MKNKFKAVQFLYIVIVIGALLVIGCGKSNNSDGTSFTAVEMSDEISDHSTDDGHGVTLASETETGMDWCEEHEVPESVCTKCNPELIAGFKESGDWCKGHDIPESHCRLCNPQISFPQEEILRDRQAPESDQEISVSLFHRPNAEICATDGAVIQFVSHNTAERAGITAQRTYSSHSENIIEAPAEIVFDETTTYVVSTTVPALVSRWLVSPGDIVTPGKLLANLQSPEVSTLKSSLISAHVNNEVELKELRRYLEMKTRGLISEADYDRQLAESEQARAQLTSARGLLQSAGLDDNDINEIINHNEVSSRFSLRAISAGVVVERKAQLGELLESGSALAILADPKSMWIEARLTEEQLRQVNVGQTLTFVSDGRGLNRIGAEIIWVSSFLDEHTRNGIVRARVRDAVHTLHAGEYGRVQIKQLTDMDVVLVPKDAVQWEGCCNVVFVKETDTRYRPRKVEFIDGEGPTYQVISGLVAGEEVVVNGAFLLKTELEKSSIGAGCCQIEPAG